MSVYYFDSSALVKRYFPEIGSAWMQSITDPNAGNTLVVSILTLIECAAASSSKHRAPKGISLAERDSATNLLSQHFDMEYWVVQVDSEVVDRAFTLTQNYRLRGYDAVQVASATIINELYTSAGAPIITMVSADNDVLFAASQEGLSVDNPHLHP